MRVGGRFIRTSSGTSGTIELIILDDGEEVEAVAGRDYGRVGTILIRRDEDDALVAIEPHGSLVPARRVLH